MSQSAFRTLGIEPTSDGRVIRAAFLRLARIYHPDRYGDQPDDVRVEAERRMKEVTLAYEALRATRAARRKPRTDFDERDLQQRAATYRREVEARQTQERRDRERWRRWQELELEARARAQLDATIAAAIANDFDGTNLHRVNHRAIDLDQTTSPPTSSSALSRRLEAAKRGASTPLAVRKTQDA